MIACEATNGYDAIVMCVALAIFLFPMCLMIWKD